MARTRTTGRSAFATLANELRDGFKMLANTVSMKAQETFYRAEKRLMRLLVSYFAFLAGVILVSIAVILLISEYFNLSQGWSFLLVGIIFLIASTIIRSNTP